LKKRSLVKSYSTTIFLRIILGLAAFALLFLIFIVYHEGGWHNILDFYRYFFDPKKLRSFIMSFGPFSVIVFVVVQALQVIVAPIPGELTGFVGGFLYGNFLGSVLSTVGLTIGSTIAFGLSRRYGLRYVEKIVKKRYIDKFNFFVTHKGLHIAFILFLIPGFPKDSLCYLLGLTHIKFVDFLFMNLLGRFPGTLMLTLQGTAVKNENYREFLVLTLLALMLTVVLYLFRNRIVHALTGLLHRLSRKKKDEEG